jgi:hypothetical protein
MPSISDLLAGYAQTGVTFGARLSGALLAQQPLDDPSSVVFPMLVVALFVSDISAAQPVATRTDAIAAVYRDRPETPIQAANAGDPCAAVSSFLDKTLDAVADAISKAFSGNFILQIIVDLTVGNLLRHGITAIKDLLLNASFIKLITTAISALAIVSTVASSLRDWSVSLNATPSEIHDTVEGQSPSNGQIRVTVSDPGGVALPGLVASCAQLLDISLPASGAPGSGITWILDGIPGQATQVRRDATVPPSRVATLDYTMNVETQDAHQNGHLEDAHITVTARIARQDRDSLKALIEALVNRGGFLSSAIRAVAAPIEGQLDALALPSSFAVVVVTYHVPPEPTPESTVGPSATPCGGSPGVIGPGTYSGTLSSDFHHNSQVGSTSSTTSISGSGTITIRVSSKGSLTGSWTYDESGQTTTTNPSQTEVVDVTGTVTDGTVSGTTQALVLGGAVEETLQLTVNGVAGKPSTSVVTWPPSPGVPLSVSCDGTVSFDVDLGSANGSSGGVHAALRQTGR